MARVVVRPQADDDPFEIADYIARDDPAAAPGLRSLPFGNYVIFYQPLEDGIEVVRVLHGKRDHIPLFGP